MAFNVRPFNHSPQWYRDHCLAEDGGSAAFRAMLTADMKFIEADIDATLCYAERVEDYATMWNAILSGKEKGANVGALQEVLEREGQLGYTPQEQYSQGPFRSIARIMKRNELSGNDVREFLKWTAKNENAKKARAKKKRESDDEKKKREFGENLLKKQLFV